VCKRLGIGARDVPAISVFWPLAVRHNPDRWPVADAAEVRCDAVEVRKARIRTMFSIENYKKMSKNTLIGLGAFGHTPFLTSLNISIKFSDCVNYPLCLTNPDIQFCFG